MSHLNGKSIVVHCGSTFGDKKGERLFARSSSDGLLCTPFLAGVRDRSVVW